MAPRSVWLIAIFLFSLLVHGLPAPPLDARAQPTLPEKDPFYVPPEGYEDKKPGTILRHRKVPNPIAAFGLIPVKLAGAYHVLYRTQDNYGKPAASVTTILIPNNADLTKVLSYQVAEDAASPNCGPSYALQLESATGGKLGTIVTQAELILMSAGLENGWVVTTPDFEGTRGAFLANHRAGFAVLDGIRATFASTEFTGIKSGATVTMWGYSGGSLASGFAAELQPSYAPELKIAGAALGGTVPQIAPVLDAVNKAASAGLVAGGIHGLAHEYPEINEILKTELVADKKEEFMKAAKQCFMANNQDYKNKDMYAYMKDPDVVKRPEVVKILEFNSMGHKNPTLPLFVYKAKKDEISELEHTEALVTGYCDAGTSVQYVRDKTADHSILAITGAAEALLWLNDRMAGHAANKTCSTREQFTGLDTPEARKVLSKTLIDFLLSLLGKPIGTPLIG